MQSITVGRIQVCGIGFIMAMMDALALAAPAPAATLVENGEARAAIVLPSEPEADEERAAEELIEHVELISGATLELVIGEEPAAEWTPIRLGGAADAKLDAQVREQGDNVSAFALVVDEQSVAVRGLSAEGTLVGVYELLEQLGVRWYHPGDLGRVIPDEATLTLETQRTIQAPSVRYRRFQHIEAGDWPRRMRLRTRFAGDPWHQETGSHGIDPFGRGAEGRRHFENNPEYFALVDGKRRHRQICVSHPDVLELATEHVRRRLEDDPDLKYVSMGPDDGHGYCECEDCKALDQDVFDPIRNDVSLTDRYVWFFNQMLDRLEDDHPNVHIVWYVYSRHMMPPAIDPNPRIVGVVAPSGQDRIRGMDNPMSPDRYALRWIVQEWEKTKPNEMYYRGYYNNLACPQFPLSQLDRARNDIPALYEMGIDVMRVEVIRPSWSAHTPSLYLAARMMWDVETDADEVLEEFYELFYGPAREPMKAYHEALESAFRDTPYFTGSSYPYIPIFLDHPRRNQMRVMLDEAAAAVPDEESKYAERVRTVRMAWDRMNTFLDMIDARNNHDFATAHEKQDVFYQLSDEMVDYVLEAEDAEDHNVYRLLNWHERADNPRSYFNRFFADPVEAGYERTVQSGDLVAALPDEWNFLLDPAEIGNMAGYSRPGELGGNWKPIKTTSRSWSDQGLHYYKGVAWYRTRVHIPERYEGRPLYLWFGSVDSLAHVWINGDFIGTSEAPEEGLPGAPGSLRPFDMPATNVVNFGQENWVVVKIENHTLAELGTGGILAPVMFWSPNDPEWSP